MSEQMQFPKTFEEFAKEYGFKDKEQVYTNGAELIPVFRVKQWLEHIKVPQSLYTDEEIAKSFIEDVEAVKEQLPPVEPYEEVVSRAQLVRELNAQIAVDAISRETAIDMLEHLPSVNVEPQEWIPVKDRLPTESDEYYVSMRYECDDGRIFDSVTTCYFDGKLETWRNAENMIGKILAWQPITEPSPYKGDEE